MEVQATLMNTECDIIQANANDMHMFENDSFEAVVCNSTLEHDRYFWKTIDEIHRVTASNGFIMIGVPGFSGMGIDGFFPNKSLLKRVLKCVAKIANIDSLIAGTPTLGEHFFPGDYYRFTEQAMREVFLKGLERIEIRKIMNPPRILGFGRKP